MSKKANDSEQRTLDMVMPVLREVRDELKRTRKAIVNLQNDTAFYQEAYGHEHVEKEKLEESLLAMKAKRTLQHQSMLYHDNETKFRELRKQIWNCMRRHLWTNWNPVESPRGIPVATIVSHVKMHPWAETLSDETISRRIRELHDPMKLLSRPFVGYYLLHELSLEQEDERH